MIFDKKKLIILLSLLYSIFLVFYFPVDASIVDRLNYLIYTDNSINLIGRYYNQGILSFLFNEPLWLILNVALSSMLSSENVIRVIIFFSSFSICYYCLINNKKEWLFVFMILFLPQIIKNNIIHLRQGLAISIFVIGFYSKNRSIRNVLISISPFIHVSFFIVITIYLLSVISNKLKYSSGIKTIVTVSVGIIFSLSISMISIYLGARQADEYSFSTINVSGAGFLFWLVIFVLLVFQGKNYFKRYTFEILTICFYLSSYFFTVITARIFENAMCLVLIACCHLTSYRKFIFIFIFGFYFIANYIIRINMEVPYLGWGVK
ncbi:EpsG family protein [Photobacterium toruni]|uniref:EpsG family protein n=1 Tax=Photobacterium toruni TaxID=1935446 RepID=UPI002E17E485|nr:EpsG family protein [Photobacterium toruni]